MTYAAHWARVWSLVGAVGVGLAFLVWRPASVLTVFLTAALCAGLFLVLLAPAAGPRSPLAAVRWTRLVARAFLFGAGVVALAALCTLAPVLAFALGTAAVVSSPWCVDRLRRRFSTGSTASTGSTGSTQWPSASPPSAVLDVSGVQDREGPVDPRAPRSDPDDVGPEVTSVAVRAMSDRELCREWRHSFVTLQTARNAQELVRVVSQRQVYLDEMERRSPSGLQAWLDSGARAAGGPERYLTRRPRTDDQSDAA